MDQVSEFEYDLFIRPDTCNPRFRVWFNFTVENVKESQVREIVDTFSLVSVRRLCFCFRLGYLKSHDHIWTVLLCIYNSDTVLFLET